MPSHQWPLKIHKYETLDGTGSNHFVVKLTKLEKTRLETYPTAEQCEQPKWNGL